MAYVVGLGLCATSATLVVAPDVGYYDALIAQTHATTAKNQAELPSSHHASCL